jgi:hypothetical protein
VRTDVRTAPRILNALNFSESKTLDQIMTKRFDEVLMMELEVIEVAADDCYLYYMLLISLPDKLQLNEDDIVNHTGQRTAAKRKS